MYVGLKQPRGDGERYVTPAREAAKETTGHLDTARKILVFRGVFHLQKISENFYWEFWEFPFGKRAFHCLISYREGLGTSL